MKTKRIGALLFIVSLTIMFFSCASYSVGIHTLETPKNHFIVVSSLGTIYDCYSIVDGKWKPVCKVVEEQRSSSYRSSSDEQ